MEVRGRPIFYMTLSPCVWEQFLACDLENIYRPSGYSGWRGLQRSAAPSDLLLGKEERQSIAETLMRCEPLGLLKGARAFAVPT